MKKNIKTFIHKLLDRLGYKIIKNENLINFSLDNFKKSLKGDDLKDLYKNENFFNQDPCKPFLRYFSFKLQSL